MRFALVPILLLAGTVHAGSIHKWVDEDGNVHYGDAPPVTAKTENIRVLSAPSNPGRALPRLGDNADGENAGGTTAATNDDTVPADQAKIACEQAQEDTRSRRGRLRIHAEGRHAYAHVRRPDRGRGPGGIGRGGTRTRPEAEAGGRHTRHRDA